MSSLNARLWSRFGVVLVLALVLTHLVSNGHPAQSSSYEQVVDDLERITLRVPGEWVERDTAPTGDDEPHISAAPDIAEFRSSYDVSGVTYIALPFSDDLDGLIEAVGDPSGCEPPTENRFDNGRLVGTSRTARCGPECAATHVLVFANPDDESFTAQVETQAASDDDLDDLDAVLKSVGPYDADESMSEDITPTDSMPATGSSFPSGTSPLTLPADLLAIVAAIGDDLSASC